MIIVTGGAGFIGSNLIYQLNQLGHKDIVLVDHLKNGYKIKNINDCMIADYYDRSTFIEGVDNFRHNGHLNNILKKQLKKCEVIFHLGACSATTEWDGQYIMQNNYEYSKMLFHFCQEQQIPLIYASSAAVYGNGPNFIEQLACERPLNVYAYSKWQFDQYIRRYLNKLKAPVVGLRYFNVYGPREQQKGSMASVAFHFNNQCLAQGRMRLFEGSDGYANGEQLRDFVYVEDCVDVNLWFWQQAKCSGIFNVGTGVAQTFNDVANAVAAWHKKGNIEYIPFPEHLKGNYQSYTQASLTALREAGYKGTFKTVEAGVKLYLDWLSQ